MSPRASSPQLLANSIVSTKRQANPYLENADLKKIKGQALAEARSRVKAKKISVDINDKEWEAIQAGAISKNTLSQILNNTDLDRIKQLATPRSSSTLTSAKQSKAKLMLSTGYTQSEVADALGVSTSTISNLIN